MAIKRETTDPDLFEIYMPVQCSMNTSLLNTPNFIPSTFSNESFIFILVVSIYLFYILI